MARAAVARSTDPSGLGVRESGPTLSPVPSLTFCGSGGRARIPSLEPRTPMPWYASPMDGSSRVCWLLTLCLIAVLPACGVDENVVALVGGHELHVNSFQEYLAAGTGMSWEVADRRVASRLFDQFIDREVVAAAAATLRGTQIPVEPAARSAVVRSLLKDVCGPVPPLPQEALDREIARRLEQVRPARSHVRQLLLETLEDAEAARRRLDDGEKFEDVSRSVSRAPNAAAGGELGFVVQGTLPQDLDDVIFEMEPGTISQPVPSPAGYHIFQVLEVIREGTPHRSEVEIAVTRELTEDFSRDFTRECVDRLAGEVGVAVFRDHLWFQYEGRYWRNDEV